MQEDDVDQLTDQMLNAARGGLSPREALQASQADPRTPEERASEIEKNRERARRLLAALEKSLGQD